MRWPLRVLACGALILLWLVTLTRASRYQSEQRFWQDAVATTPTFRTWMNYRTALMRAGDFDHAIEACGPLRALARTPWERRDTAALCGAASPR